jgi:MoaA/NifB/PqqE/SkfB family radical SAM enzyme
MCDIWKSTARSSLTCDVLRALMPEMRRLHVEHVVLTGGEPLMNPEIERLCAMLHAAGFRTTVLTTGLLLARYAQKLASMVDEWIISLDGPREVHDSVRRVPGAYDAVARAISALRCIKARATVRARCTVQKLNHGALCATARAAHALGFDSISYLAVDATSTAFNRAVPWENTRASEVMLDRCEIDALDREIEALARAREHEYPLGFVVEDGAKLRRIADRFRAHIGKAEARAPRCNAPWVSAIITGDGSVKPCFFHAPIGNIRNGLEEAVNGAPATAFRASLDVERNEICRRCVCSLHHRDAAAAGTGGHSPS